MTKGDLVGDEEKGGVVRHGTARVACCPSSLGAPLGTTRRRNWSDLSEQFSLLVYFPHFFFLLSLLSFISFISFVYYLLIEKAREPLYVIRFQPSSIVLDRFPFFEFFLGSFF